MIYIQDEGSLPEIALSGAFKLALTYFTLFYRSVHELYTETLINDNEQKHLQLLKQCAPYWEIPKLRLNYYAV